MSGDHAGSCADEPPQEHWRRDWDDRARTIADPFELTRGEPVSRHASGVLARRSAQLRRLIGDVGELRVLDVGSGAGATLSTLPEAGLRIGVDLSMGMLRRSPDAPSPSEHLLLINGSAESLPAVDAGFDCTLCLDMLQYLDDESAERALGELVRVTRAGGRLILYVRNSRSPVGLTRQVAGGIRRLLRRPRAVVEHYRSSGWYRRALAGKALLRETYAYGLHPLGVGPVLLLRWSEAIEDLGQRLMFGRPRFGVHRFMRFEIDRR